MEPPASEDANKDREDGKSRITRVDAGSEPPSATRAPKWQTPRRVLKAALLSLIAVLGFCLCIHAWRVLSREAIWLEEAAPLVSTAAQISDGAWFRKDPAQAAVTPKSVLLTNDAFSCELFTTDIEDTNPCCSHRQNGLRTLLYSGYPAQNLFSTAGLNFEHILSGRKADWSRSEFAPRKEPCALDVASQSAATLFWPSHSSTWNADSQMDFSLAEDGCIDFRFRTHFAQDPGVDYLLYMWANYMRCARSPDIHFYGVKDLYHVVPGFATGNLGWVSLTTTPERMKRGERSVVSFLGTPQLSTEEDVPDLNFGESTQYAFLLPLFLGIADGDGSLSTTNDDMAFIMMFDDAEPLRFATWDFSSGEHRPVWDWQYVIRDPKPGNTYGYRGRLVYKPYVGLDDAVSDYVRWGKSLEGPRCRLKIEVVPPESADVFPSETTGEYASGVRVYFGVNPSKGWKFHHWQGNVEYPNRRFTSTKISGDETVRAICRRRWKM